MHAVRAVARTAPPAARTAADTTDVAMNMIGYPREAQCVTCGGVLAPAGDDWRHVDDTGCTEFGEPTLCRLECSMPAAVGGLSCPLHLVPAIPANSTAAKRHNGRTNRKD